MDPHVHLRLTDARVDASLRRAGPPGLATGPRPGFADRLASAVRSHLPRRADPAPTVPPDPVCGPAT